MKIAREKLLPILFLIDTPLLIAIVLFAVFGFSGYYGQDSHEYLRFASEWKESGFDNGVLSGFHWPLGFPVAGIILSYLGLSLKWSLVLVSLLSAWGTLLLLNRMIRDMYGRDGTIWVLLGAATQVYFIRGGMIAMSDMLCTLFVLASVFFLLKYKQQKQWMFILLACTLSLLAFSTRYAVVPFFLIPFMPAFSQAFREENQLVRLSAGLFLVALCSMFVFADQRFFSMVSEMISQWHPKNFIAFFGEAESGWQERTVPNLLYGFGNFMHLGYLSTGIFLLPYYRRIAWKNNLLLGIGLYLLFIMGLETQNYRFLMIIHPVVLFLLFPAFDGLKRDLQSRRIWLVFVVGILVINGSFFVYSFRKTYAIFEAEKTIAGEILDLKADEPIYSFYVDQAFLTYGVKNEIRNLYLSEYNSFEEGALVIFNPTDFEKQWEKTLVWKNWERLNEEHELELLKEVYGNWKIYRIR